MSLPTKFVKIVTPLAFAIALASCGGGGSEKFGGGGSGGGSGGGGGGEPVVVASSIDFTVSSRQLGSDGSTPVVLSAIAKDENNNALKDAEIVFSVDNGATIDSIVTGETSSATVKIANLTPNLPENRTLNVTATSGDQSKTIKIEVVGTTVVIDGPSSITQGKEVPYILKLKDSSNKPISFEDIELIAVKGSTITAEGSLQTNGIGELAFTLSGLQAGTETLTAKALGVEATKNVEVSDDDFTLSGITEELKINTSHEINFAWNKSGTAQKNKEITLSTTRGTLSSQSEMTDESGKVSFTISSVTAGQTVISATSTNGLSTTLVREFIATTPEYLNSQADPSLIAPKGSSTIIAKIRDINDNPVKNKIIDFRLDDTVDGKLSASTAVTDSLGRASVSYTAGNSSSAKDGVKIATFIQGYETVGADDVFLTVGGNALRIVLGDDHLLVPSDVFYIKKFGVIVTDSAGNPMKEQKVDFTIIPTHYGKGFMVGVDTTGNGKADSWAAHETIDSTLNNGSKWCVSEDFDNDGQLDAGEDRNGNGTLEPTHDATVTGSGVTDEQGKIIVEVVYPKNHALWSRQDITAVTRVEGTEFVERTNFVLPVLADDVTDIKIAPPNMISPYGFSTSCLNDDAFYDAPITAQVVDALTGAPTNILANNIWYKVRFVNALGKSVDGQTATIASTLVTVSTDTYGNFKLTDKNEAIDSSGFGVTMTVNGIVTPLYYDDDDAIVSAE